MSAQSLQMTVSDIADSLVRIDSSGVPHGTRGRTYLPGVGPYGEPQLLNKVAQILNSSSRYRGKVETKRNPDLLIRGSWGLEFKIVRPFGDNGREAENWSVNLLHPYEGNQSSLGDCLKLLDLSIREQKAIVVIGYEHIPPLISLQPLVDSFEIIAKQIIKVELGPGITENRKNLIHPIHQQLTVFAWEVLGRS